MNLAIVLEIFQISNNRKNAQWSLMCRVCSFSLCSCRVPLVLVNGVPPLFLAITRRLAGPACRTQHTTLCLHQSLPPRRQLCDCT